MTQSRFLPCPACARHIRASEAACPFCAHALTSEFSARPVVRSNRGERLSRAALFALGTAAAAMAACGDTDGGGSNKGDAAAEDGTVVGPVYGAPPVDSGTVDSGDDDARAVAAYGAPPVDASDDSDGGSPFDASKSDGAAPAYGGPPPAQ